MFLMECGVSLLWEQVLQEGAVIVERDTRLFMWFMELWMRETL